GEALLQWHVGGDDDDLALGLIRAHAHFGDDVAGLGFFLELVLQLDQRFLAVIGVDLADDDFAGGGYLVDREGGAQEVVGLGVGPVAQAPVGVGFAQFAAWVNGVFGAGAGHGGPELHIAAFGLEVLIVE